MARASPRLLRISCVLGAYAVGAWALDDVSAAVQSAVHTRQPWLAPPQGMPPQPWLAPPQGMQPQPWMAPPPGMQPQPWMAPPPGMQPAPWMAPPPAAQPEQPAQAQGPAAPAVNKYIYNFLPDNGMCCMQGPKSYLTAALARLRSSPMAAHYASSKVTLGMCQNVSYTNGPYPATCFPRAALYTDDDPLHVMTMIDFDTSEAQLYASARSIPMQDAMAEMKSACDDGTMEQGLQLSLEESQAQVYIPPMASLIPDNGMACMQGTIDYLQGALTQIRSTPLAEIFNKTEGPVDGMCSEYGYTTGSGGILTSGHGRIKSKCFPKATLFWDNNASHHDQLMWVETRALKGPTRYFNFTKYEERREQIQDLCQGRAETIFRPVPPNLR